MPETLHLPEDLRREIIDHCHTAVPNEGCGLFAVNDKDIVQVYPTTNADDSPTGYTIPPEQHFAALEDAESRDWELGGVFHSHPRGSARPSMIDVTGALDPEWIYLVVSLRGEPAVRAWRIREGRFEEVTLI